MLVPATTNSLVLTAIAQTANQSLNAAVNWCNRSISREGSPVTDIVTGFCGAVGSAVGISVGANIALNKVNVSAGTRVLLKAFVPWPAVATASCMNMLLMRRPELTRGVAIRDLETDDTLGASQAAARMAIWETGKVRFAIASCAVLIPQALFLASSQLYNRYPGLGIPTQALYALFGFGLGVPFSRALSTQEMTIPITQVEEQFQNRKNSNGNPIHNVVFNKGL
jgi:sideroflexin-5